MVYRCPRWAIGALEGLLVLEMASRCARWSIGALVVLLVPSLQADECIPFSLSCLSCFVRLFREFGKKNNEKNEWSRWGDKKIHFFFSQKGDFFPRWKNNGKKKKNFF